MKSAIILLNIINMLLLLDYKKLAKRHENDYDPYNYEEERGFLFYLALCFFFIVTVVIDIFVIFYLLVEYLP